MQNTDEDLLARTVAEISSIVLQITSVQSTIGDFEASYKGSERVKSENGTGGDLAKTMAEIANIVRKIDGVRSTVAGFEKNYKSPGHSKLERVNRRFTLQIEQLEAEQKEFAASLKVAEGRVGPLKAELQELKAKLAAAEKERTRSRRLAMGEVDDLRRKLWGGFSEQAIRDLDRIRHSNGSHRDARAQAAWDLCRFHTANGNLGEARSCIEQVRSLSKTLMRGTRQRLLEIQILALTADLEQAELRAAELLSVRPEAFGNARLAIANIHSFSQSADAPAQVLNALNEIYEREGLSKIAFRDEEGSLFTRLSGVDAPEFDGAQKVSILMPAYNAEQFIRVAVNSMRAQTYRNIEIVIVDDCSTDNTWTIIQELAQADQRIVPLRNEVNSGAYPTRNRALHASTGDIINVHDADDWSHPQMIEQQVRVLQQFGVAGTFSMMCRASEELVFKMRPAREVMEYVHRSYPSLMMRRQDVLQLGEWDSVRANADDEFVRRARTAFGEQNFLDVCQNAPLSIFLSHGNSLTESADMNLRSLTFGSRQEYGLSANYWLKTNTGPLPRRTDRKSPFPCPSTLLPVSMRGPNEYDLLLVSDLSLLGGTRSCNLGYIDIALKEGRRVALFHWPRSDLRLLPDVAADYRERIKHPNCDIITCEEQVVASSVLIHHPPILAGSIDKLPKVECSAAYILVNQLPLQVEYQLRPYYTFSAIDEVVEAWLAHKPTWLAISPFVRRKLAQYVPQNRISEEIWYPPFSGDVLARTEVPQGFGTRDPILGRHARNHWTKWPASGSDIRAAYMVGSTRPVHVLGGADSPIEKLGATPLNWIVHPFDSLPVIQFIDGLDLYINYNHPSYFEEFGRNIMEAMARGVPVIADPVFEEVFGDAIIAAEHSEVGDRVQEIWTQPERYLDQSRRGEAFVTENCAYEKVAVRLGSILGPRATNERENDAAIVPAM